MPLVKDIPNRDEYIKKLIVRKIGSGLEEKKPSLHEEALAANLIW